MKTEWKKVRLGDIATFSNGINFGKESYAKGVKLITVSDFGDRYFPEYNELVEVDEKVLRPTDYLQNGDMVFVRSNGNKELVGRCMLIENPTRPVTYSGFCIRARLNNINENNPRFFTYYFKSRTFRRAMSNTAVGANIQNLNQGLLSNHELLLPDFETQQKIAGILSAYDDLIENNRKQIKLLEEAAQKLYKEWFVKLNFPDHENTKIVDGIPEGWRKGVLSDITDITMGQSPKSEFYNNKNEGLPFHQGVGSYGTRFVIDEIYTTSKTRIAEGGSILFSVRAPVGRLNFTKNKIVIGRGLSAMNQKQGCQSFLYYLLKNKFFKDDIIGNGAIFASITKGQLLSQEILMPTNELIKKFNEMASAYDSKINALDNQIQFLQSVRDKFLPRLINGEIEV